MDYLSLLTAFSIGLLGGAHCIGMCGGIIGALTMSLKADQYWARLYLILSYNMGRILSYVLIALLFYSIVSSLDGYLSLGFMRIIAGLLLIAMGLYLANWWRGLVYLEKAGGFLWRFIQPIAKSFMPVKTIPQAFLLGMIWGWLPCGLIYSALVYSATGTSAYSAALIMLSFALGTLPAVLLSGLLAERLIAIIQIKHVRIVMAILIIIFGLWTIINSHSHGAHH
ncbi:MAG: sulfite exporter TauE/SafE family protein [Cellvibrionaceae bacterium]